MEKSSLRDFFDFSFTAHQQKPAITFIRQGRVETEINYGDLDRNSSRAVNAFRQLGAGKGDRVILFLEKSLFFVTAHLALQKMGAVSVPLNPNYKKSELAYLIKDAAPRLVVTEQSREPLVKEAAPGCSTVTIDSSLPCADIDFFQSFDEKFPKTYISPKDPGIIIYTSGTTGNPKGVVLTQENLIHDLQKVIDAWKISSSDRLCHALPLFHVHGLGFALHTLLAASGHILMTDRFDPDEILRLLSEKDPNSACTIFMAVPTMYRKLIHYPGEKRFDFSHLRLLTSGSAPLPEALFHEIAEVFGKKPVEREGMSETGMNFSNPLSGIKKPGSIGHPLPGVKVRIVDPDSFADLPPGQIGEIWLQSRSISRKYWGKPEETAKVWKNDWFRTGDLGRMDAEGYYYLTDRIKNIIISGGENISPAEVEAVINGLDDVVESAVVGIPDGLLGEKTVAAVIRKPGSQIPSEEIQSWCKKHLHDWKCPKKILFPEVLPRNTMGKVLRDELVKLFY